MSNEPTKDNRTSAERDRDEKQRAHIASIEKREQLDGCIESVWLKYQLLAHLAKPGSAEQQDFERLRSKYVEVQKRIGSLSPEEQDQILEEYPKLAARLQREYNL
ncbi:hypothetical protein NE857_06760 [Nocardiopsis exhalans]|uniref:Uncharacterized protein n=1 Tax=Nocardiopsis exhalans TaxID=163604 RepID=A0ABY5DAD7_9ACTN|nr:hypothetical protein [Nocardiopsis exhalans]USY21314.1 hypothetical protein NE857_06760 [Nocardiopsis exhalans]